MSDSKVSDLTANTEPEGRDLLYHVDLSESSSSDQSKKVTIESLFNSVMTYDDEILTYDGEILTW